MLSPKITSTLGEKKNERTFVRLSIYSTDVKMNHHKRNNNCGNFHCIRLVPSLFLFVGVYSLVDVYAILLSDPLYGFSHGISRMLEKRSCSYHLDPSRITVAMMYQSSNPKPNKVVQKSVLKQFGDQLERIDNGVMGNRKNIEFSIGKNRRRPNGAFTEMGVLSISEEKNQKNLDLAALHFEETVDFCCANSKTAPVTD